MDKINYMTESESSLLSEDISKQVKLLKENLSDDTKFVRKKIDEKISIMKEGEEHANE